MKLLLVLAILAGAAWFYFKPKAPGHGPEAQAAERSAQPYLEALERWHSERGGYPLSLDDLIPDYLSGHLHQANGAEPEYERLGATFKLTVNYTNPLPVHCSLRPGTSWACEWF
jgi:hypothetical protein